MAATAAGVSASFYLLLLLLLLIQTLPVGCPVVLHQVVLIIQLS
jgi:hypothetical protein